jgi:uncharacterized protein
VDEPSVGGAPGEDPRPVEEPAPASAPDEVEAAPYEASSEKGPVFDSEPGAATPPPKAGDTTWATACHLSTLSSFVFTPVVGVLAPLAVWYLFRRDDPRVERAAKEAFNFQVNLLLWGLVSLVLCFTCILSPVGLALIAVAFVADIVLTAVAAVRTSSGEDYRYPLTLRFLD